jgi:NADH:ubiquinone oxidoreductase subunit 6 (subunit J)
MENKTFNIIRKVLVLVIAVIALLFFVQILINSGDGEVNDALQGAIDGLFYVTYVVLASTVLMAVFVWFAELFTHKKKLVEFGISAGLFIMVILIAKYVLASNDPVTYNSNLKIDAATSNWVDTGLFTFYILGVIAILSIVLSPLLTGFGSWGSEKKLEEIPIEDEVEEGEEEA